MTFRSIKLLQAAVLSILLLFSFPVLLSAQENAGNEAAEGAKPEANNPSKIILNTLVIPMNFIFSLWEKRMCYSITCGSCMPR